MTLRSTPGLFRFRLFFLAAFLSLAAISPAHAQKYNYNGHLILRAPAAKPQVINSSTVVSPVLTAPTQIQTITRAQGLITYNLLSLHTSGNATYVLGNNTSAPVTLRGTYTYRKAAGGSTVIVTLAIGNPKGTITFHIQPGAVNYTALLTYTGVPGTTRQQFVGQPAPNPFSP